MARVELYDSKDADYDDLHEEMERRGFKRTIEVIVEGDDTTTTFLLLRAEYKYFGDATEKAVCSKAGEALKAIGKTGGIVVTKLAGIHVSGLRRARK